MRLTKTTRIAAALLAGVAVWAQNLTPQAKTPPPSDEDVIHINVNLVQVDAVVTDSKHHLVQTDLKASDFEVLQDGKAQKIINFSFVNVETASRRHFTGIHAGDAAEGHAAASTGDSPAGTGAPYDRAGG